MYTTEYLGHYKNKNGPLQGDLTKADPLKKETSLSIQPAGLIKIHQSHKVRKTSAGAQVPGIYMPRSKTQAWFHKKSYRNIAKRWRQLYG